MIFNFLQSFVNFHIDILLPIDSNGVKLLNLKKFYSVCQFLIFIWFNKTFRVVVLALFLRFDPKFSNTVLKFLKRRETLLHIVFKMEVMKNYEKLGQLQMIFIFSLMMLDHWFWLHQESTMAKSHHQF